MRKLKNVSKKCMIAILTAAMMMSTVTMSVALPVTVYAETTIADNPEGVTVSNVHSGEVMDTNDGTVRNNRGTVTTNNGTVEDNSSGKVVYNNGLVQGNNRII